MWFALTLRNRIILILSLLLTIIVGGGSIMVWYTLQMDSLFKRLVDTDVASLQVVGALESGLANQKGFVSYYFMDGNPEWLKMLEEYRAQFRNQIDRARNYAQSDTESAFVNKIKAQYDEYVSAKDRVIAYYQTGEKESGLALHQAVRPQFFKILGLCEEYRKIHDDRIKSTRAESGLRSNRLRIMAVTAMSLAFLMAGLLAAILLYQVLDPLRKLALETDRSGRSERPGDEVVALRDQVRSLMKDMEKFALVGKLAAGVAHSIRNPLTSVKMRLFSVERSLALSPTQKEDIEVISEEIRQIDTIVQNFLEFSRPPKLKMQQISPSDVVNNALQLLRHRLESYNVAIQLKRQKHLPVMPADPEQLKEVLVNIIVNACEAMQSGGTIIIEEEERPLHRSKQIMVIRLTDDGPGIPRAIQEKIFQPFFSTKEEGSGLGLTIATRIINEHGGWLEVQSDYGKGTSFVISLPFEKEAQ